MQTNKSKQFMVVLGGYIVRDAGGFWRTSNFEEEDEKTALGDRLRVVAASFLYKDRGTMNTAVIVLGARGNLGGIAGAPTIASVNENELVQLGVPRSAIIREEESNNTYGQLRALNSLLANASPQSIKIVSNRYHLPRIQAMIEAASPLALLKEFLSRGILKLVSAEEVCLAHDRVAWERVITHAYKSEAMAKIQANEARGIEDLKQGRYRFR